MHRRAAHHGRFVLLVLVAATAAACAARIPPTPPEPVAPKYPAFVFPGAPQDIDPVTGERQVRGWRFLQSGDLRNAEREFAEGVRRYSDFAPAETGMGYVALARRQVPQALDWFGRALMSRADYAPALVGRAEAFLALDRYAEALESFEAAAAADASLTLAPRMQVLRLRVVQDRVSSARMALQRGDLGEARTSYEAAIAASPDSGFLHRELALVERREGKLKSAAGHFRKAAELDPSDVRAHTGLGETLEASGDLEGALAAYEAAWALEHSPGIDARIAGLRARIADASLPSEYQQISGAPAVTRGDFAALLGVRMEDWLASSRPQPRLITDAREHWAAPYIVKAVQAGIIEPFPNHTFQPDAAIRRGDLALIVSRVLNVIAQARPGAAAAWRTSRPEVADVPRSHLAYPAVAQAIGAGVLGLSGGEFHLARPVSGAEAIEAVERLRAIAGPAPLPAAPSPIEP